MIKIENTVTPSAAQWNSAIMGARNAMNSWNRSDSDFTFLSPEGIPAIGEHDLDLMKRLRNAGSDHRKFMRMLPIHVEITAPFYWWKEFSTYKIGTVANSCSTMHKIHSKEFILDDFSHELLLDEVVGKYPSGPDENFVYYTQPIKVLQNTIDTLNVCREKYLETKERKYWDQMIQLLPNSYNQKRTIMLNYEVLANMYHARKNHKLDEWHIFCDWVETLPYSELITGEEK